MTDPSHYEVKFGENPHTRTRSGGLKSVDAQAARRQWERYVDTLRDHGVDVYLTTAKPGLTGMVFAANAGFIDGRLNDRPVAEKTFYESHFMVEHRMAESALFADFMRNFGFLIGSYDDSIRFEGEADGFPVGGYAAPDWIFTFGFRSDPQAHQWLSETTGEEFFQARLSDPRYYHGDCLICDLGGPFLVYPQGLEDEDYARMRETFGDRIVELADAEADAFVGNSFYVEVGNDRLLFATAAIGDRIRDEISERGVEVVGVEITEFFAKGGGGPKCMVFNLGEVDPGEEAATDEQREFRSRHRVSG